MWHWWQNLSRGRQRLVSLSVLLVMTVLLYRLAFGQTLVAWQLNRQLNRQLEQVGSSNGADIQLQRKRSFYQEALRCYQVRSEDMAGYNWERVSALGLSTGLKIGFKDAFVPVEDSLLISRKAVLRPYQTQGEYRQIVSWLDSLGKVQGLGWVYELKITKPKKETSVDGETKSGLVVSVTTAAIK